MGPRRAKRFRRHDLMRSKLAGPRLAITLVAFAAVAAIAAPGASAAGAVHVYPGGALNAFTSGLDGWTGAGAGASTAVFDAGTGNPPGSLKAQTAVLLLTGSGTGTFTSPSFAVPAGPAPAK